MIIDLPQTTEQLLIDKAKDKGLAIHEYLNWLLMKDSSVTPIQPTQTPERFPIGLMQHHPKRIQLHDNFDEPLDDLFDCLQ